MSKVQTLTEQEAVSLERVAVLLGASRGSDAAEACLGDERCPQCDLSGEWAGAPLARDVVNDILHAAFLAAVLPAELYVEYGGWLDADHLDLHQNELFHDLLDAFQVAYDEAAMSAWTEAQGDDAVPS